MKILIVSPTDPYCGVAQHTQMLMDAVRASGAIGKQDVFSVSWEALDPQSVPTGQAWDVIHLNYQAALHSRWQPEHIKAWQRHQTKILVTYHDSGVPNSDQCKQICTAADWFVLHEPYDDLPAHGEYLRMGVTSWAGQVWDNTSTRPVLGTVGHDFGWKCWPELAKVTAQAGWGLRICCPEMSVERQVALQQINPRLEVERGLNTREVLNALHGCDATGFTFVTHNTGQSASILLGIGALKPVIALDTCRQFRALFGDPLGRRVIAWCETFEEVFANLTLIVPSAFDTGIVALAEQEDWSKVGARYGAIYQGLVEGTV